MSSCILVTGGAGYIGSHTVVELVSQGHQVIAVDNFANSQASAVEQLKALCPKRFTFVNEDIRFANALDLIFEQYRVDAVIHFAGSKAVGESVREPIAYFENNVLGTLALVQAMARAQVRRLVFSSSATVYGDAAQSPIPEKAPLLASNPYGQTKLACEHLLQSLQTADPRWHVAILRYFNPVGAHPSGLIGERPNGVPDNLMPYLTQVAAGLRPYLNIFGSDYPTSDGTGVRDYVHVTDLVLGHLAALRYLNKEQRGITVNLGSGRGASVLELVHAFERATGVAVPHRFSDRRAGDVACSFADTRLAQAALGWTANLGLDRMCSDAWRWQSGEAMRLGAETLHPRSTVMPSDGNIPLVS